jgi:hypothetical protein
VVQREGWLLIRWFGKKQDSEMKRPKEEERVSVQRVGDDHVHLMCRVQCVKIDGLVERREKRSLASRYLSRMCSTTVWRKS